MSYIMAFGMELSNVARNYGGLTEAALLHALRECAYMGLIVFVVSNVYGNRAGRALAHRCLRTESCGAFLTSALVSCCTVLVMCPSMSLIATALFTGVDGDFLLNWVATVYRNFDMALLWQLFFAAPLVRLLFRALFHRRLAAGRAPAGAEKAA